MRKTILTLAMMLIVAIATSAAPTVKATAASKRPVAARNDTAASHATAPVKGIDMTKVQEKINEALDDTLTGGAGTTVEIGNHKGELAPEDIKEISNQWASVVKQITINGSVCLLALVALVLLFRFLNRRNKYRVIEKAIENNYPLNELSLGDVKRSAIYVQQPVVQAPPVVNAATAQQQGQVPVGKPLEGTTPGVPITVSGMVNWRALMPAVKWIGWGVLLILFSVAAGNDGEDPFWPIGLALTLVGVCKGYILYKEQKALQDAWNRAKQQQPRQEPMREGIPVPPAFGSAGDDHQDNTYQPY
jgi:hypothetical protein